MPASEYQVEEPLVAATVSITTLLSVPTLPGAKKCDVVRCLTRKDSPTVGSLLGRCTPQFSNSATATSATPSAARFGRNRALMTLIISHRFADGLRKVRNDDGLL